jgi:DnaJ domain
MTSHTRTKLSIGVLVFGIVFCQVILLLGLQPVPSLASDAQESDTNTNADTDSSTSSTSSNAETGIDEISSTEEQLDPFKDLTFYEILGVEQDADDKKLKKAYRKKALVNHPDKYTQSIAKANAERRFVSVVNGMLPKQI